jgi:hypothetical protein
MLPKYPALTKASYHLKGSTLEEREFANEAICIDLSDIDLGSVSKLNLDALALKRYQ